MTCRRQHELLTQALYNELDASRQREYDEHLASCANCQREFESMKAVLAIMNKRTRIEPNEEEWNTYWQHLRDMLEDERGTSRPQRISRTRPASLPVWAYGIAAMLLIAIGIFAGRTFFTTQPTPEVASPAPSSVAAAPVEASRDSIMQRTLLYLERSRNLLIGLANLEEARGTQIDLSSQQRISRQLIDQGNVLTVSLNGPDQQLTRKLIEDLQVILMQLANTELTPGVPVVELVKKGIDEKSILLKINLEAMRATEPQPSRESHEKKSSNRL